MKKEYLILDSDGSNEYTIIKEDIDGNVKLSLYYSNTDTWEEEVRGELAMSITDNGNSITFNKAISKSQEYFELEQMRLLINFKHQTEESAFNRATYKAYSVVDGINL